MWGGRLTLALELVTVDRARRGARRNAALRAAGWREVVRFGWDDVVHRPDTVVARVRRLRAEAA